MAGDLERAAEPEIATRIAPRFEKAVNNLGVAWRAAATPTRPWSSTRRGSRSTPTTP